MAKLSTAIVVYDKNQTSGTDDVNEAIIKNNDDDKLWNIDLRDLTFEDACTILQLAVDQDMTESDVTKTHRRLSLQEHPDKSKHANANHRCQLINASKILILQQVKLGLVGRTASVPKAKMDDPRANWCRDMSMFSWMNDDDDEDFDIFTKKPDNGPTFNPFTSEYEFNDAAPNDSGFGFNDAAPKDSGFGFNDAAPKYDTSNPFRSGFGFTPPTGDANFAKKPSSGSGLFGEDDCAKKPSSGSGLFGDDEIPSFNGSVFGASGGTFGGGGGAFSFNSPPKKSAFSFNSPPKNDGGGGAFSFNATPKKRSAGTAFSFNSPPKKEGGGAFSFNSPPTKDATPSAGTGGLFGYATPKNDTKNAPSIFSFDSPPTKDATQSAGTGGLFGFSTPNNDNNNAQSIFGDTPPKSFSFGNSGGFGCGGFSTPKNETKNAQVIFGDTPPKDFSFGNSGGFGSGGFTTPENDTRRSEDKGDFAPPSPAKFGSGGFTTPTATAGGNGGFSDFKKDDDGDVFANDLSSPYVVKSTLRRNDLFYGPDSKGFAEDEEDDSGIDELFVPRGDSRTMEPGLCGDGYDGGSEEEEGFLFKLSRLSEDSSLSNENSSDDETPAIDYGYEDTPFKVIDEDNPAMANGTPVEFSSSVTEEEKEKADKKKSYKNVFRAVGVGILTLSMGVYLHTTAVDENLCHVGFGMLWGVAASSLYKSSKA